MNETQLVVPCYNEAHRLPREAFLDALAQDPILSYLFVDDGSTDDTARVLEELRAQSPERIEIVTLEKNSGKAEAVRRGMCHALEAADPARFVGYWDADLATPLDEVRRFRGLLQQDTTRWIAFGARVKLLGRSIERNPLRHYLGRVFATAASTALKLAIYDTQCGAKLFRSHPALPELFGEPFISNWIFDVEVLARLRSIDSKTRGGALEEIIVEVPLRTWHDVAGSKVRARDFPAAFFELLAIHQRYLR